MNYLIDTNVLIALEPTTSEASEYIRPEATEFYRQVTAKGFRIFYHPLTRQEVTGDNDTVRRELRVSLLNKYQELSNPPPLDRELLERLRLKNVKSHDEIDFTLLSALTSGRVDRLVTQDNRLIKYAMRLGLDNSVMTLPFALEELLAGDTRYLESPPNAIECTVDQLNLQDSIWDTLKESYPSFSSWIGKCQTEKRRCWIVQEGTILAGVCIVNKEASTDRVSRRTYSSLKICTFKIADKARGNKYGELLLRAVFDFMYLSDFEDTYVEINDKHTALIELVNKFGFERGDKKPNGDRIYLKHMKPTSDFNGSALDYNIKFGPHHFLIEDDRVKIIPIQQKFLKTLIPVEDKQLEFSYGKGDATPQGNALRKVYVCHSKTKSIEKGSLLLFYATKSNKDPAKVVAVGVAEASLRTDKFCDLSKFVGSRSVYNREELQEFANKEALAILFRFVRVIKSPILLDSLIENGLLKAAPQSITSVKSEGVEWLKVNQHMLR